MNLVKCFFVFIFGFFVVTGCSTFNTPSAKRLKIEKKWVRNLSEKPYYDFRRLHRMKPIIEENMVIAGNSIDGIVAYDRSSAKELWRIRLEDGVEAGVAEDKDFIYFGSSDGFFYKARKINGEVVWSFPIRSEGLGRPTVEGNRVYFVAGNNIIYSLDTESGKSVWLYNRRDPSTISVRGGSRPSVDADQVYVGFSDGSVVALSKSTGNLNWESTINTNKRFQDVDSHPTIDGQYLYAAGFDNSLQALDKSTGSSSWQVSLGGYSAPLLRGSLLYYATTANKVVAVDKQNGKIVWEQPTDSLATKPVEHLGLLFVGEFLGGLKLLDLQSGQVLKEFKPGRGVHSEVAIDKKSGDFYFMSADGNLFSMNVRWTDQHRLWPWEEQ